MLHHAALPVTARQIRPQTSGPAPCKSVEIRDLIRYLISSLIPSYLVGLSVSLSDLTPVTVTLHLAISPSHSLSILPIYSISRIKQA